MTTDRYFEELHKGLCENNGCGGQMALVLVLLLFLLCSCKTARTEEKTDTRDSVRIEYKESSRDGLCRGSRRGKGAFQ